MDNFDNEEELVHHMQEKHAEVVQRIKGAQVPWTVLLPFSTGWKKNRIKSDIPLKKWAKHIYLNLSTRRCLVWSVRLT